MYKRMCKDKSLFGLALNCDYPLSTQWPWDKPGDVLSHNLFAIFTHSVKQKVL